VQQDRPWLTGSGEPYGVWCPSSNVGLGALLPPPPHASYSTANSEPSAHPSVLHEEAAAYTCFRVHAACE